MNTTSNIIVRRLEGRMGGIAYQLTGIQFFPAGWRGAWCPAINAYRCRDGFVICVELAGVDRSHIDLKIELGRLLIRGRRLPPEPGEAEGPPLQVIALEIDHGLFEREIMLPEEINPNEVKAEQRNGLLWIRLPLRSQD